MSGTRLRARVQVSPDGARTFRGWYDNQLHVNCFVALAGDGQQRCLPYTQAAVGVFFSDPSCTGELGVELTQLAAPCPPTLIGRFVPATTCTEFGTPDSRTYHYAVGPAFRGTVYTKTGTSCFAYTDTSQYPYTDYSFYQLGAEVPPSTYVAITTELE